MDRSSTWLSTVLPISSDSSWTFDHLPHFIQTTTWTIFMGNGFSLPLLCTVMWWMFISISRFWILDILTCTTGSKKTTKHKISWQPGLPRSDPAFSASYRKHLWFKNEKRPCYTQHYKSFGNLTLSDYHHQHGKFWNTGLILQLERLIWLGDCLFLQNILNFLE